MGGFSCQVDAIHPGESGRGSDAGDGSIRGKADDLGRGYSVVIATTTSREAHFISVHVAALSSTKRTQFDYGRPSTRIADRVPGTQFQERPPSKIQQTCPSFVILATFID